MPNITKKAIIIGLNNKQKKLLRVLLKHQANVCQKKENERRQEYMK